VAQTGFACLEPLLLIKGKESPREETARFPFAIYSSVLTIARDSGKFLYRPPDKEFRYLRTVIVTAGVR